MSEQRWEYTPASDAGLPPMERFRSTRREQGLISWSLHHAATLGLRGYFRLAHAFRVHGGDQLPTRPPFVVIANHASHLDALILAAALPRDARGCAYPVAAGDVFFESATTSVLTALFINALPLWRKKVTRHALDELRERLLLGQSGLILFPEGARSRDGEPLPFKGGIGRLVAATSVPVVPCWIDGAFEALPADRSLPRPRRIHVTVGPARVFASQPNERAGWDVVATELEQAVLALRPARG